MSINASSQVSGPRFEQFLQNDPSSLEVKFKADEVFSPNEFLRRVTAAALQTDDAAKIDDFLKQSKLGLNDLPKVEVRENGDRLYRFEPDEKFWQSVKSFLTTGKAVPLAEPKIANTPELAPPLTRAAQKPQQAIAAGTNGNTAAIKQNRVPTVLYAAPPLEPVMNFRVSDSLEMHRKPHPSDVSDDEWAFVAPYLTLMSEDAPQRQHRLREVFNAVRWIARTEAQWRWLPNDLPPWYTVYQQAQRWIKAGVFEAMVADLRVLLRVAQGRKAQPTAAIFDSRTLQPTPESGGRAGYDGAKRRKGNKTHIAVDTLGNLLALLVTPANEQDRGGGGELAEAVQPSHGRVGGDRLC